MTVQEASVRIGADASAAMRTLKSLAGKMAPAGEEVGKEFKRGFDKFGKRMFDALGVAAITSHVMSLGREFRELEGDAEALEKRFGKLSDAQRQALGNVADMQAQTKVAVAQGASWLMGIVADAGTFWGKLSTGMGFSEAANEMITDEMEAIDERRAKLKAQEAAAKSDRFLKAETEFEKIKYDFAFKRMTKEEQIAELKKDEARLIAMNAEQAKRGSDEQFKTAAAIIKLWERIAGLQNPEQAGGATSAPLANTLPLLSPFQAKEKWLEGIRNSKDQWLKNTGAMKTETAIEKIASGIDSLVNDGVEVKGLLKD